MAKLKDLGWYEPEDKEKVVVGSAKSSKVPLSALKSIKKKSGSKRD